MTLSVASLTTSIFSGYGGTSSTEHWQASSFARLSGHSQISSEADDPRRRQPCNWVALLSLPLVFLGLVPDLWRPFEDYARVEDGRRSTFFLVPFKGRPGVAPDGTVNAARAVPYQVTEIQEDVRKAASRGSELAVHGIDAWRDAEAGREEIRQLTTLTSQKTAGVRMHWLYFDVNSPRCLESAGFDYDSTWGYNETVGYRAGTSQVFGLAGSRQLMELPLSIMDSALFYPGRMGLDRTQALQLCRGIVIERETFWRHARHQLARS